MSNRARLPSTPVGFASRGRHGNDPRRVIRSPRQRAIGMTRDREPAFAAGRQAEMVRPPFTFERNTLGSNGTFPLRFIAGPPYRVGVPLTRLDRTRLHAKATSGTRWFPCHRSQ